MFSFDLTFATGKLARVFLCNNSLYKGYPASVKQNPPVYALLRLKKQWFVFSSPCAILLEEK